MKGNDLAWRFQTLPHAQRVSLREVMLRGAAREYVENTNTPEEEAAALELFDAAIAYAVIVLQKAQSAATRARSRRATKKEAR